MFKGLSISSFKEDLSILTSLSTSYLDLVPGTILFLVSGLFREYPYLLLIYPQILSFRGSVIGILVGRYSTSLHLGVVKPYFKGNTREYYTLIYNNFILLVSGSVLITILTSIWLELLYGGLPLSFIDLLTLILSITFSSTILTLPLNLYIGNISYRRGLDPDVILYPFASTLGDISITVFFILYSLIYYVFSTPLISYIVSITSILILFPLWKFIDVKSLIREFMESILAITIVSLIVGVTGNLFRKMEDVLKLNPMIYIIYPSLLTLAGDSASIVGSKASTIFSLRGFEEGYIKYYFIDSTKVLIFSLVTLLGISIYSSLLTSMVNIYNIAIILAGLVSCITLSLISIGTAYLTYIRGLDPDHFINPIVSVSADMVSTIILYIVLLII